MWEPGGTKAAGSSRCTHVRSCICNFEVGTRAQEPCLQALRHASQMFGKGRGRGGQGRRAPVVGLRRQAEILALSGEEQGILVVDEGSRVGDGVGGEVRLIKKNLCTVVCYVISILFRPWNVI